MPMYKNINPSLLGIAEGRGVDEVRRTIKPREVFECSAEAAEHHLKRKRIEPVAASKGEA